MTWNHYKILITVKDEEKRHEYERAVLKKKLGKRELRELVYNDKQNTQNRDTTALPCTRGFPGIYRGNTTIPCIDLGFRIYHDISHDTSQTPEKNTIVTVQKKKTTYVFTPRNDVQTTQLYIYKGYLKECVDGDTIWITLDLGFNTWTTRKLRLKGINAPDINTTEGKEAHKYIEKQLNPGPFLIVKTYWRDKYNRYLADIFYNKNETKPDMVVTTGKYLNQILLDKGLARKYTR